MILSFEVKLFACIPFDTPFFKSLWQVFEEQIFSASLKLSDMGCFYCSLPAGRIITIMFALPPLAIGI